MSGPYELSLENVLNQFELVEVINDRNDSKMTIVHAVDKSSEKKDAVLIFEKPHFNTNDLNALIGNKFAIKFDIKNDVYSKFNIYPEIPFNSNSEKKILQQTNFF